MKVTEDDLDTIRDVRIVLQSGSHSELLQRVLELSDKIKGILMQEHVNFNFDGVDYTYHPHIKKEVERLRADISNESKDLHGIIVDMVNENFEGLLLGPDTKEMKEYIGGQGLDKEGAFESAGKVQEIVAKKLGLIQNRPCPWSFEKEMEMLRERMPASPIPSEEQTLRCVIKATCPSHEHISNPLIEFYGHYDGSHDRWTWHCDKLDKASKGDLKNIYNILIKK